MSPSQFKYLYLNLRVHTALAISNWDATCTGRFYSVGIRSYRNADINTDLNEKGRLVRAMRRGGYSGLDRTAVARAFCGKASVNQCKRAVAAIVELDFAHSGLQRYCDTYLGLDCSGFVNNYFLHVHGLTERNIRSYYRQGQNRLRTSFDQFRAKDVLIWCNRMGQLNSSGAHIGIIDTVGSSVSNELAASVVESTGTLGLVESTYRFRETSSPGVYAVFRPLKPNRREHVKVVPVL